MAFEEIRTFSENLLEKAEEVKTVLEELRPLTRVDAQVQAGFGPFYFWGALSSAAIRIQVRANHMFLEFQSMADAALVDYPHPLLEKYQAQTMNIRGVIDQGRNNISYSHRDDAFDHVKMELDRIVSLISQGDSGEHEERVLLVPDTNALLFNPNLVCWSFESDSPFELVFVQAVLQELDTLKSNDRNMSVKQKAQQVVRFLKECRRRGGLKRPVAVVSGRSWLSAIAIEPPKKGFPNWLSDRSKDDRILRSTLDLCRKRPRARVALVTRDIHMINKADILGISCLEPPEGQSAS